MFKPKQPPIILATGIDRLVITVTPSIRLTVGKRTQLRERGKKQFGDRTCVVLGRGVDPLENDYELADFVLIDTNRFEDQVGGPVYHLAAGAKTCATLTNRELLEGAMQCIDGILDDYHPVCAVSYLELYVDMQKTLRPTREIQSSLHTRSRKLSATEEVGVATPADPDQLKLHIGSRDRRSDSVRACYYEKPLLDATDWRMAFWSRHEQFDPKDTVRRLEFRIPSRQTLAKLAINPSPAAMLKGGLNTLWAFLTTQWLRVVQPSKSKEKLKNHAAWDKIIAMKPMPDCGETPRDFVIPESAKKLERQVAMGAGFLRNVARLPDTPDFRDLSYMAFLDAVRMLQDKQLPFDCEDNWERLHYQSDEID